jgi:hypothetical protein
LVQSTTTASAPSAWFDVIGPQYPEFTPKGELAGHETCFVLAEIERHYLG